LTVPRAVGVSSAINSTQDRRNLVVSIGSLPLARFTVLDLTHARAGPTAVRQLADWGANVIKIEPPGESKGDVTGSRREGFDFQNLHRNKRSLTLNLKTEEGKAIFLRLAEKADVIVENFRSEVKFRLGVDYESVKPKAWAG
jgi:formyl-CoA transferase